MAREEADVGERPDAVVGQGEAMRESQFAGFLAVLEVRGEFRDLAEEAQGFSIGGLEAHCVSPTRQPLEQFDV